MINLSRILLLFGLLFLLAQTNVGAQDIRDHLELKIRNDNAGELSNWLNTGDDLGETHGISLLYKNYSLHPKYYFKIKIESVEFSGLDTSTVEKKDLVFDELYNFQFSFGNNKFQEKTFFYALSAGLIYIQSQRVTVGATGIKYLTHKYLLSKMNPDMVWVYNESDGKSRFFPFVKADYGFNKLFLRSEKFVIQTKSVLKLQLASQVNFSYIGARINVDFRFLNERFKLAEVALRTRGDYYTAFSGAHTLYASMGMKLRFQSLAVYADLCYFFAKNLNESIIQNNDSEPLFEFGFVVYLSKSEE